MGEPCAGAAAAGGVGEEEEERLSRFPLDNGKERVWGARAHAVLARGDRGMCAI